MKFLNLRPAIVAALFLVGAASSSFAGPLSSIAPGGTYNPATDKVVTIRNGGGVGNPDVQTTLGSAATQPSSAFLQTSNNLSDLPSPATARSNLGLAASAATDTTNATNITSGLLPAARLPLPTISNFGGVFAASPTSNQFVTGIDGTGAVTKAQPSAANISGLATSATTDTTNASNIASGTLAAARGGAGTVSGILKANGSGAVSAAVSGTDFQAPLTLTTTGTSGAATLSGGTLNIPQYSGGGGSVSVTASTPDIVVNPSPGTGTFTIGSTTSLNAQGTAASYTITAADMGKTITHARSSAVADTLPQAGTTGFGSGVGTLVANFGTGAVTVTASGTSTINGAASAKLWNGGWDFLASDGTNWNAIGFPGYGTITSGSLVKFTADTSGGLTAATAGTDFQAPLTLTTTGTSGAATLTGNTLNIPQYSGGGGGVSSLNSLTGALNIVAGSNVTVTASGTSSVVVAASSSASTNLGGSTSAASPQISGDATTGFYTPGAAQVGVSISGTGRMTWTSTGTTNNGTFTTTGAETNSANGAASTPAMSFTGTITTGGTGTTNVPHIFYQPSGATAVVDWNTTGGSFIGANFASGFSGNIFDFRINGSASSSSVFRVTSAGVTQLGIGGVLSFASRSRMDSPANGVMTFNNSSATGFTRLNFGGTTTSFPAIQVNGTGLESRLADGSALTTFSASNITAAGLISGGTKFTASGCSNSTTVGGATAGTFVAGVSGTCTVTITMNGATGLTAPNGWHCSASNRTTSSNLITTTGSTTTTATIAGTTVTGDVVSFACTGY